MGKTKSKKKFTPSHKVARRKKSSERRKIFNNQKAEEQQAREIMAREEALKKLDIIHDFGFADHNKIYNFADDRLGAPIQIIDASVPPPAVTSYPEYPVREFSSPSAFGVNPEHAEPKSSLPAAPERVAAAFTTRRAKAIMLKHVKALK